ncbi:hypothetical protein IQ231_22875 [Cuspidothrix issatschenkoi LEGE 03284]|uniref:hypothetical protein n=1 Tax=Cuspidothrix issatschenkoi TaxID=230752 RepID=UPI001880B842|nr:hypothetical protein [Cuspidothrix issatschenkoi]MBE9234405.1 hypothetical protein [Cuspidothrix issatschenkoi LEGE 03284]
MFKLIQKTISVITTTAFIVTTSYVALAQQQNTDNTSSQATPKQVISVDSPEYTNTINGT